MRQFLYLSLFVFAIISCHSQPKTTFWNKTHEQGLRHYLDSVMRPAMTDTAELQEYISFYVMRAKQEIPNGLNSVSKDSLHRLNDRINLEYSVNRKITGKKDIILKPSYTKWSHEIEQSFRNQYASVFENYDSKSVIKFCDCMIYKYKKIYPDSLLLPIPKDINEKTAMECKENLKLIKY